MPKIYGLVGHPVKHSFSPAMHNAAFKYLKIDGEYRLFDIEPDKLKDFLAGLASNGIYGVNVTIPYKITVWRYLEKNGRLDRDAKKLGAVNTVKLEDNVLKGFNTDGAGFYRSLVKDLGFEPYGKHIFFLGAGGAARAIIMYLGDLPREIYVMDIDIEKANELRTYYGKHFDVGRFHIVDNSDIKDVLSRCELLVNATPIGMKPGDPIPLDSRFLHQGLYVYDLVYNRPQTALVKEASIKKLHAVTGLGMLLFQGAIALELWTGQKAPLKVMKRALERELTKNHI